MSEVRSAPIATVLSGYEWHAGTLHHAERLDAYRYEINHAASSAPTPRSWDIITSDDRAHARPFSISAAPAHPTGSSRHRTVRTPTQLA